jgi:hypothetical protein
MKNVDKQVDRMVKDWYASNAHHEWLRLQQDPYHKLEFKVTMHFHEKCLPRRGTALDAGGGPGRYSIELARQGYSIEAKHHWESGDYFPGLHGEGFTVAHWFLPEELRELVEQRGVNVLEMAGLEGLSSHYEKKTNRLHKNRER